MQKSFKDWWDDKYFSNLPFYSQYEELHRIGADLDFVDRLAGMLLDITIHHSARGEVWPTQAEGRL